MTQRRIAARKLVGCFSVRTSQNKERLSPTFALNDTGNMERPDLEIQQSFEWMFTNKATDALGRERTSSEKRSTMAEAIRLSHRINR